MTSSRTRRWLLRSAVAVGAAGGLGAWFVFRDGPDRWGEPLPFLTDESVFYDRWSVKRYDPAFWLHAAGSPDVNPMGWSDDGKGFALEVTHTGGSEVWREAQVRDVEARQGSVALLKTMRCSGDRPSNRLASNGVWTGVPLRSLLDPLLQRSDRRLRIRSADGFSANLRIRDLDTQDGRPTLLAFALNGAPLSHDRGGPVRLIVPDRFGFKNLKWPRTMEITSDDTPWGNHEVDTPGGTDDGWVTLGSKLLRPDLHMRNPIAVTGMEPLLLRGVAFGGREVLQAVQVRIGDASQPWRKAALERPKELFEHPEVRRAWEGRGRAWPLPDVWTPWMLPWAPPAPGDYGVAVRGTSVTGNTQPDSDNFMRDADSRVATGTLRVRG